MRMTLLSIFFYVNVWMYYGIDLTIPFQRNVTNLTLNMSNNPKSIQFRDRKWDLAYLKDFLELTPESQMSWSLD